MDKIIWHRDLNALQAVYRGMGSEFNDVVEVIDDLLQTRQQLAVAEQEVKSSNGSLARAEETFAELRQQLASVTAERDMMISWITMYIQGIDSNWIWGMPLPEVAK